MRTKLLCFLALFFFFNGQSQELQNANWCFGSQAHVSFNTTPPAATTSSINNPPTSHTYAAGTVSDDNGNLLFYTNGETVWDKNHLPMPNGTQLIGDAGFENIVIVPKPYHEGIYYIFTGTPFYNVGSPQSLHFGIYYSVVDMSLNNSNGDIVAGQKNIPLKDHNGTLIDYYYWAGVGPKMEVIKMTTTKNDVKDKVWASFFVKYVDNGVLKRYLYSYLVSENGINATADGTSPVPTLSTLVDNANYPGQPINDWFGYIKISPDGQYMCDASSVAVNMYSFNNQTGGIAFIQQIYTGVPGTSNPGYGLEFSPNSQFVYFATYNNSITQGGRLEGGSRDSAHVTIYQNRIGTHKITPVASFAVKEESSGRINALIPFQAYSPYNLQLGLDNKIYVCNADYFTGGNVYGWLGAVELPDLAYPACNYNAYELQLAPGTNHWFGLPQWVHRVDGKWPKVYTGKAPEYLWRDNSGNLFMFLHEAEITTPNINHTGVLPGSPYTGEYTFHYSASGVTRWTKTDIRPTFVLSSGLVQMDNWTYINGATGASATPPSLVPSGEAIIAETGSGAFITYSYANTTLYVHATSGTTSLNSGYIYKSIFNPATNKLFVLRYWPTIVFDIYTLSGNTLTLSASTGFPGYPSALLQINNQDQVFVVHNGIVQEYNYNFNSFTPVSISGFVNSDIFPVTMNNYYTGANCLVYNSVDENLYALDLDNLSSKKIHTTNYFYGSSYCVFDGDKVFLAGRGEQNVTTTIGTQSIVSLPPYYNTIWLTRLSLQNDFSFRQPGPVSGLVPKEVSFTAMVYPNPAVNSIRVTVQEFSAKSPGNYSVSIYDHMGNKVIGKDKYQPGALINLSGIKQGIYYLEIADQMGNRISRIFNKQ